MAVRYLTQNVNGAIALRGTIHNNPRGGFDYRSYPQNGSSRKPKADISACIPHKFNGYLVDDDSILDAIAMTVAYRSGHQWAVENARQGKIVIVHDGEIA